MTAGTRGTFSAEFVVDEHFELPEGRSLADCLASGDLTGVHHLIRYHWAVEVVATMAPDANRILDLGAGGGYGAALLARAFPKATVLAVDYDAAAMELASRRYELPNLRFQAANLMDWRTLGEGTDWDVMTCFDVIEHIPHRELMLRGAVERISPAGMMLFSTPSGHPEDDLSPQWEHHRIEYCAASLFDFLRRYFEDVVGQDQPGFPCGGVFARLEEHGLSYVPTLNPAICRKPIVVANPYGRR